MMLREAFLKAGVPSEQVLVVPEESEAVLTGLGAAEAGDLLLIFGDNLSRTWKQIVEFNSESTEVRGTELNADDEHCLRMADYTEAENICYATMNPKNTLVKEHIRSGGRAVVLEEGMNGDMITIYDNGAHIPLLWTHLIPATLEGRAIHNVQNAMFAAAMAFSMKLKLEDIRHGLRTFDTTYFQAPGRLNVFDEHPFKVILDYGHNPAAIDAVCGRRRV